MYGLLAEEMLVAPDKSAITFRIHPKARFSNGDPVTADDVKYSFDSLIGPAGVAQYPTRLRRRRARRRGRRANDPLRPARSRPATDVQVGGGCRCSRASGRSARRQAKPFDQIVNEYPITSGPYTIARADFGPAHRVQAQPGLLGARPAGAARHLQLRPHRLPLLPGRRRRDRGVQGRRVRHRARVLARDWVRQHAGPKWRRRPDHQAMRSRTASARACRRYQLNSAPADVPGLRVREALDLHLRLRDGSTATSSTSAPTASSPTPTSRPKGLPSAGRAGAARAVPRRSCRPRCSGRRYVAPRTDGDPNALRAEPAQGARAARAGRLEARRRRRAAQRQGRAVRVRVPDRTSRRRRGPSRRLAAQPREARHHAQGRDGRLRAVQQAPRGVRLRHDDDRAPGDSTLPAMANCATCYGSQAADEKGQTTPRRQEPGGRPAARGAWPRRHDAEQLRDACRALDRVVM